MAALWISLLSHPHVPGAPTQGRNPRSGAVTQGKGSVHCDSFNLLSGVLETKAERLGSATLAVRVLAIRDVVKRPKVIRRGAEVWVTVVAPDLQDRPYRRKKRRLSGAVLADQQGQRRQARSLLLPKAAEVAQSEFLERSLIHPIPVIPCPAKDTPGQPAPRAEPALRRTRESGTARFPSRGRTDSGACAMRRRLPAAGVSLRR